MDNSIPGCQIKPFKCCFAFSWLYIKLTLIIRLVQTPSKFMLLLAITSQIETNYRASPIFFTNCKLMIFFVAFFFVFPVTVFRSRHTKYQNMLRQKLSRAKDKKFLCDEKNVLLDWEAPCCLVGELKYSFGVIYLIVFSCFWTNKTFFRYNKVWGETLKDQKKRETLSASGPKLLFCLNKSTANVESKWFWDRK